MAGDGSGLIPRMVVPDVAETAGFLRAVFDATGEVPDGRPAELRVAGCPVLVSAAGERAAFPAFLYVYVSDVDDAFARACAAGAEVVEEPGDTPYGERRAMFGDAAGNLYQVARRAG